MKREIQRAAVTGVRASGGSGVGQILYLCVRLCRDHTLGRGPKVGWGHVHIGSPNVGLREQMFGFLLINTDRLDFINPTVGKVTWDSHVKKCL